MDEGKTTLEGEEEEVTSKEVVKVCIPAAAAAAVKSDVDDNVNAKSTTYSYSYGSTSSGGVRSVTLPEIEATVSYTTLQLQLRICCVRRKGNLANIYREAEEHHMIVLNTNVLPIQTSGLDLAHITLIAQMEETQENDKHVEDLVKTLHAIL